MSVDPETYSDVSEESDGGHWERERERERERVSMWMVSCGGLGVCSNCYRMTLPLSPDFVAKAALSDLFMEIVKSEVT